MRASKSGSRDAPSKDASSKLGAHEFSSQNMKLLELAEQVAHFGSWELDVTQPRAVWSPGMFRVFGVKPQAHGCTWQEYLSFIHPDDREPANRNAQTMLNSPLNHRESFDYRIICPDGNERMLHSQRQVVEVDAVGKAKVVVGVDQDVTERWQVEEALRRGEERFRAVAEAANVMVYETDLKTGKIQVLRGSEELAGYKLGEVNYTVDWVLSQIHPDDVAHVKAAIDAAQNPDAEKYAVEYRFRHKNGNYITVKDTAKAVKDASGKTVLFIGGARDITQRRLDQEKIKQYSRHLEELVLERTRQLQEKERLAAIGQTAGMVGHDIRNPLQTLTGEVYLIKTELAVLPRNQATKNIAESLLCIEQGISYINKIVADLQDYSKQLIPDICEVDLENLVVSVFETVVIPDNTQLVFNMKPVPHLKADPTYLKRALANLVNNAFQAMPGGGKLEIAVYPDDGYVCLLVTDTGVGIPDELKSKIFSPMFTTKAKGQGLGLAVVKRLIEAQGGTISFQSEEGKGTAFTIKIPI